MRESRAALRNGSPIICTTLSIDGRRAIGVEIAIGIEIGIEIEIGIGIETEDALWLRP